eukprot:COSAG06_NODE_749_length_12615_cov_35.521333_13_plen_78_part_01
MLLYRYEQRSVDLPYVLAENVPDKGQELVGPHMGQPVRHERLPHGLENDYGAERTIAKCRDLTRGKVLAARPTRTDAK